MKVELHEISIRDITNGYADKTDTEEGIVGYSGKLDIRPKYQRNFVYSDPKRNAVIDTIQKNFPLNIMYWVKNGDGAFEILDGQQRTISFCQYVDDDFTIADRGFKNLTDWEREQILDYKLTIYFCEGNDKEKLDWFRVVNTAGEELTPQELLNAIYTGTWLADAKSKFSKTNCAAFGLAKDYVSGSPIRQEFLETALKWISGDEIAKYMSAHQHDPNANELWLYFQNVIHWVESTFVTKRKEIMKRVDWGALYNEFRGKMLDAKELEREIHILLMDDDVTSKKGIYPYVLTHDEKHLNIRTFTESQKVATYERQGRACINCGGHFELNEMEADHITPWHDGGKTIPENCQMLCRKCHDRKSGK